ncbi:MAG: hypothetical protein Unbinned80contig1000_49 [Prokaryotic dsDNA virus sp.]|nr:MAG: hypothetical protein Unbinned80contig1000_49 [Prokaryotic dsDNA virus sp.]
MCSPAQVVAETKLLSSTMDSKFGKKALVRSGRSDYENRFRGDWEEWQRGVVTRSNATTGQKAYDVFVVTGVDCGRATANILRLALEHGRPVFWWNGQEEAVFKKVARIEVHDEEDWSSGWVIVCKERKPKQMPLPFGPGEE